MISLENKYKMGDTVYALNDEQRCEKYQVIYIDATINDVTLISYMCQNTDGDYKLIAESKLYDSETEMMNHIFNKNIIDYV